MSRDIVDKARDDLKEEMRMMRIEQLISILTNEDLLVFICFIVLVIGVVVTSCAPPPIEPVQVEVISQPEPTIIPEDTYINIAEAELIFNGDGAPKMYRYFDPENRVTCYLITYDAPTMWCFAPGEVEIGR